nr:MAG TPA: hypothetical protein [Caudoviricetes sp.]
MNITLVFKIQHHSIVFYNVLEKSKTYLLTF